MVVTFTDCVLVEIVLVGTVLVGDTISWKPKFRSFKTNSDFFYLIERVISKSRGQILYRRSWSRGESPCRTSTWSSTAGRKSTWGTTVGRKLLGHWLAWILWSWRRPEIIKDCFRVFCFAFTLGLLALSKTFWKIETANAIFWMYLGGTA